MCSQKQLVSVRLRAVTLTVVGAYFPPYQEQTTELLQYVSLGWNRIANPRIILAGFNMTPVEVQDTGWMPARTGCAFVPQCPYTCTAGIGRVIDFAIGDQAMRHIVQSTLPVYDVPCRPHIGVVHWLHEQPRHVRVNQLVKPKAIPPAILLKSTHEIVIP